MGFQTTLDVVFVDGGLAGTAALHSGWRTRTAGLLVATSRTHRRPRTAEADSVVPRRLHRASGRPTDSAKPPTGLDSTSPASPSEPHFVSRNTVYTSNSSRGASRCRRSISRPRRSGEAFAGVSKSRGVLVPPTRLLVGVELCSRGARPAGEVSVRQMSGIGSFGSSCPSSRRSRISWTDPTCVPRSRTSRGAKFSADNGSTVPGRRIASSSVRRSLRSPVSLSRRSTRYRG